MLKKMIQVKMAAVLQTFWPPKLLCMNGKVQIIVEKLDLVSFWWKNRSTWWAFCFHSANETWYVGGKNGPIYIQIR